MRSPERKEGAEPVWLDQWDTSGNAVGQSGCEEEAEEEIKQKVQSLRVDLGSGDQSRSSERRKWMLQSEPASKFMLIRLEMLMCTRRQEQRRSMASFAVFFIVAIGGSIAVGDIPVGLRYRWHFFIFCSGINGCFNGCFLN